jgi:hypothetical protein
VDLLVLVGHQLLPNQLQPERRHQARPSRMLHRAHHLSLLDVHEPLEPLRRQQ